MYEIKGNTNECNFTHKVGAGLEPQEGMGHDLTEAADHDVTQTINDESVWTMEKYVAFVNRNRELYDEVMVEEINTLDKSQKKGWVEKYCMQEESIKRKYECCDRI